MNISVYFLISFTFLKTVCSFEWTFNVKCYLKECCERQYIPLDFDKLEDSLKTRVYGQPLVEDVVNALRDHYRYKSQKALTISFHGWPGSGKNYVTKFIAEALYKYGQKSEFVHHFIGRIHFPVGGDVMHYRNALYQWLKGNITACPKQLFVFDEVDKMPPGVLNALKPIIDYRDVVDGVDYTSSVFIFLSNTGSKIINKQYLDYWKLGRSRKSLKISDFEKLIQQGAFNEEGGFQYSDTIQSNLIDHYIPFLPMEHEHVRKCIEDEFKQRGALNPSSEHINEVLNEVEWGPEDEQLFSKTGCKRISQRVGLITSKYYRLRDDL